MDQDGRNSQKTDNLAGVLATCTSEACNSKIPRMSAHISGNRETSPTRIYFDVACPLASVKARIGRYIVSFNKSEDDY